MGKYVDFSRIWFYFSVSRDRYFQFHNVKNGQRLGGYLCSAWCTALAYDEAAKYAFIGDYSGQITVCQLSENGVKLINVLKGHNGSIQSLNWDGTQGWLYSGKILFWYHIYSNLLEILEYSLFEKQNIYDKMTMNKWIFTNKWFD